MVKVNEPILELIEFFIPLILLYSQNKAIEQIHRVAKIVQDLQDKL